MPDPRHPFLGVQLTTRVDGAVLLGPNAVPALSREGYRLHDLEAQQVRELLRSSGLRSFAKVNAAAGVSELRGSLNRRAFIARSRRYVPEICLNDVRCGPAGGSAQAMDVVVMGELG